MFVRSVGFTENQLREAVGSSRSWVEVLRRLGYCISGGNHSTVRKYAAEWGIDSSHFDQAAIRAEALRAARKPRPLEDILVRGSTYSRGSLKKRLYAAGLKERRCELCGQDDVWRGEPMSLILDHVNGVRDDNRIENLQIVCPNCAATLSTHCGRGKRHPSERRRCLECGEPFYPSHSQQRFCSHECGGAQGGRDRRGIPQPESRKVERPPYEQLVAEIEATSYLAVGRKYGVSDNAIRKWVRWYELERERASAADEAA